MVTSSTVGTWQTDRNATEVVDLITLSVGFLGQCGWMLSEWDRWVLSRRLLPLVRALKQRHPPGLRDVDALFDQLAMFQERYDAEELDRSMHCLLAARARLVEAGERRASND